MERDKDRPTTHNHQLDKSGAGLIERIILSTFPLGREFEQSAFEAFEVGPLVQVAGGGDAPLNANKAIHRIHRGAPAANSQDLGRTYSLSPLCLFQPQPHISMSQLIFLISLFPKSPSSVTMISFYPTVPDLF